MKILTTAMLIALFAAPVAQAGSRHYYGGGHHTVSHGGHYSGARSSSSHKGGHYRNVRTANHYGRHR